MIGPSGCGKSTYLRSVNRIVERFGYVRTIGSIEVMGNDIFGDGVELVQVRKQLGMVLQRPNPLPLSMRGNILFGTKMHRQGRLTKEAAADIVEEALRKVLLWDTVSDCFNGPALGLSLE